MTEVKNVTVGKPKIGGSIYSAPIGTELPTDATTPLNIAFKNLGYVSEDGVTNNNTASTETIKAWGGDIVATPQTEKTDTFTFALIEALNIDVLKEVYGATNVSGTLEDGLTITANSKELANHSVVIEMILGESTLKRIVIPNAKVTEVGEIPYKDGEAVQYETTIQAFPDKQGNTHYEYLKKG